MRTVALVATTLAMLFSTSLSAQQKTSVSGELKNFKPALVSLYENGTTISLTAQANVDESGVFSLAFDQSRMNIYKLQFDERTFISLVLEPGEQVRVTADFSDFFGTVHITGSTQSQDILSTDQQLKRYKQRMDSINNAYYKALPLGISDTQMKELTDGFQAAEKEQQEYIRSFVNQHPSSMACLFIIDRLSIDQYFDMYAAVDAGLNARYPDNVYVQGFHTRVENARRLAIGSPAPEIELPAPDGSLLKLSSLKGKVVLIDFWASWCSPCRKENPNVVRLFNANKDKGFTIYSVSLDKDKASWEKAIQDDGLTWNHVSDLKFWQSEGAKTYNVTAVPYTVLLDRKGNIVAKNLRGAELEKKVAELLGE